MLPPGTLRALKGQTAAIVCVALFAAFLTALRLGVPSGPAMLGLCATLVAYQSLSSARWRHKVELAKQRVELAAAQVQSSKAPHRAKLQAEQPNLPLEDGRRSTRQREE